ncbi:hypothetical protein LCGC14_1332230 [marine sediment metagenome]|uniref:Uncharacterized protein n=1 Tax=marine sediment metagenome TaxID=412755 RepID=A0A0F9MX03_9ZZZZ
MTGELLVREGIVPEKGDTEPKPKAKAKPKK